MYVDGVKVGMTTGGQATPHLLVSRLCEGETSESDGSASSVLGWRQALPPLLPGRHEVPPLFKSYCPLPLRLLFLLPRLELRR